MPISVSSNNRARTPSPSSRTLSSAALRRSRSAPPNNSTRSTVAPDSEGTLARNNMALTSPVSHNPARPWGLPSEISDEIFSYLDAHSLAALDGTAKAFPTAVRLPQFELAAEQVWHSIKDDICDESDEAGERVAAKVRPFVFEGTTEAVMFKRALALTKAAILYVARSGASVFDGEAMQRPVMTLHFLSETLGPSIAKRSEKFVGLQKLVGAFEAGKE